MSAIRDFNDFDFWEMFVFTHSVLGVNRQNEKHLSKCIRSIFDMARGNRTEKDVSSESISDMRNFVCCHILASRGHKIIKNDEDVQRAIDAIVFAEKEAIRNMCGE